MAVVGFVYNRKKTAMRSKAAVCATCSPPFLTYLTFVPSSAHIVAATCSTIFFTFLPSLRYALLSVSFICRASIALSTSVNSFPSRMAGWSRKEDNTV